MKSYEIIYFFGICIILGFYFGIVRPVLHMIINTALVASTATIQPPAVVIYWNGIAILCPNTQDRWPDLSFSLLDNSLFWKVQRLHTVQHASLIQLFLLVAVPFWHLTLQIPDQRRLPDGLFYGLICQKKNVTKPPTTSSAIALHISNPNCLIPGRHTRSPLRIHLLILYHGTRTIQNFLERQAKPRFAENS